MPCTPISVLIIWHSLDKAISVLAQGRIILSVSLYKGVQHLFERNPKAFFNETAVRSSFKEVQESMEEGHHSFRIESLKYLFQMTMVFQKESFTVEGQRGPKRGFPTLRCDAPGGGWRCDAATLRRSGGRVALRRCDAATLLALRRGIHAATLLALRRGDAATRERRGSDAATLLALRRYIPSARVHTAWRVWSLVTPKVHPIVQGRCGVDVFWCSRRNIAFKGAWQVWSLVML